MKLKKDFLVHELGGEQVLVATGEAAEHFRGVARSNETAAFIVNCLKSETDPDHIVARMLEVYDVPEDLARADLMKILDRLRSIGALDE